MRNEQVAMGRPKHVYAQDFLWTSPWGAARFMEVWYGIRLVQADLNIPALALYRATFGDEFLTAKTLFSMN